MPSDIRSFFGGKPAGTPAEKPKEPEKPNKRGRARKVVDEDDEDEPAPKKATPKKTAKKEQTPELEETTTADYFGKGSKPKRSEVLKKGKPASDETTKSTPKKGTSKAKESKTTPSERSSARKKATTNYAELDINDFPDDDMEDDKDDVFKASAATGRKAGDGYEEATDGEDDKPLVPQKRSAGKQKALKREDEDDYDPDGDVDMKDDKPEDDFVVPDDDEEIVKDKPAKKAPAKGASKRKSTAIDDEDDEDLEVEEKPAAKKQKAAPKKAPAKKTKKEEPQDSAEIKGILDDIPTIDAPEPPGPDGEKKKFQFGQHANSAMPAGALDFNDLPTGQENCLAGLSFVFTGQLQSLGRDQGQNLVKQYGGKCMAAPSKKTSYVVLGEDAGPKKLQTIKDYQLKVINEEGLFALISRLPANGGDSAAAEKQADKVAKEEEQIRKAAAEMEKQERAQATSSKPKPSQNGATGSSAASQDKGKQSEVGPDSRLWTVKYAPQSVNQICGNKGQVEKLQRWLRAFPKNQRTNFKLPGPDGSGMYRAVMIHGPPGIGKTTAAHLIAKLEGFDIVESNASDTRSKKLVETGLKGVLSTTSLMGYFGAGGADVESSKKKLCLIMDEVDGMSAGDRGGVGALAAVCKKAQIPMILICNDRKQPKMKPFDFVTYDLGFRRPTTEMIRSRISTIAFREGLKMPPNVINALIEGTGADIRQVVNMISTSKLDSQSLSFEDSKDMSKAWEKHIVLKPWDLTGKILGGGLFNPASKSTLNEKIELYFNDHDFAPLMLQENYLGTNPQRSNTEAGRRKAFRQLDLVSKAADSISDGDLVDRMIHGSQQQWSLMPTHAVFSFVRPASYVHGSMAGHQTRFTQWMGNNSKQGRLVRLIKDIQGHMRLRTSGDRHEVRQTYMPLLWELLVKRLEAEGKEAVPEIIELMDSYYLTKEDWDAIMELGVGTFDMEKIKIETQAKATFTRLYNAQSHPLPFIKSSQVVAPTAAPKVKPDLEEALDESDDEAAADPEKEAKEQAKEDDLTKDKYVKAPKKKRAAAAPKGKGKAAAKPKGKGKAKDDSDEEMEDASEEEDVKPKKGRGKAATGAAKGKGKAKK
ncbi:hypothetical protein MBLNU230_g2819t1 [Neophaeotheca triangularis]